MADSAHAFCRRRACGSTDGGGKRRAARRKFSKFDGNWLQLLGVNWLCNFVTVITLSFGQYWAHCYKERWFCKHRTIDGKRLTFDGKAMQYFGKRMLWQFLSVITLGVFIFWLEVKTLKWTVSHSHIVEEAPAENVQDENATDGQPSEIASAQ